MGSDRKPWFIRKGTIVGAAIVVVAGAGVGTWLATSSSSAAPLITTTTTVQTVGTGTITQTVASSGTLEPASQANLDFGVSGQVTAVDVTAGQTVTAGQPLAAIDPTSLTAALAQAQAELANDQSQLAADQAANASAAQIASDEANIASTQTSLSDATLTSTIAGTVAAVNLTVGQQVDGTGSSSSTSAGTSSTSAGTGAGTGSGASSFGGSGSAATSASTAGSTSASSASTAQVVVVSTGSFLVNTSVNSTQVGQLKVGDQATITVSGSTASVYGTVGSIGLLASTSSSVSSFPVVINVTGSPSGLYGGSSATVSIITEELQDVVVVPTTAIHYSGNATTVTLDDGGKKISHPVTIGEASGGNTQVTSGLTVGQKVYVTEVSFHGGLRTGGAAGLFGGGGGGFTGGGGFRGGEGFAGGGGFGG